MRILRNVRLSWRALAAHPARTALAVASTGIGVAGVLLLAALGEGARREVMRQIDSLGRNVLVVTATRFESRAGRLIQGSDWTRNLRSEDAAAILHGSAAVVRVAPVHQREFSVRHGPLRSSVTVIGTTPEWRDIRQLELTAGRFFDHREAGNHARVAVIGSEIALRLFADSLDPVGRMVRIGAVPFRIVGVLASRGLSVDGNATEDDRIIVPIETALNRLFAVDYLQMIYFEAAAGRLLPQAEQDAGAILRARRTIAGVAIDDFVIQQQRALVETQSAARVAFRRLLTSLALLSLLLGGVGILSIMLLSLRERRREIGLRVAVGARRRDILIQFLAEAALLAGAGGAIGVLLGTSAAAFVSAATRWQALVTVVPLTVAALATGAIAITAGVLPAWRAATLDPIASLHSS